MKGLQKKRRRFSSVALVAKTGSREALRLTATLERSLARRGMKVVFDDETAAAMGRSDGVRRSRIASQADLVLVVGGDGTLLSVAREAPSSTRILGVNAGALGFLAGLSREEATSRLGEVLSGGFREERRRRLEVVVSEGPNRGTYRALNDAVLNKEALARISTFSIALDGRPISEFRADGVIVATPTGSTAYNLSAGGPILHPALRAVVITPICPHTLSQRPLVVPGTTMISLRVVDSGSPGGVHLTLDGQAGLPVPTGSCIEVRESRSPVTLLRPPESDHFHNLSEKMRWGV
ncbi:MAG TPA: NAD(+)/NADH kinase [Thermoanaerobaculia bacterium]